MRWYGNTTSSIAIAIATSGVGVPSSSSSWFCCCCKWKMCHNNTTYPVSTTTELVWPYRNNRNVKKKVRCLKKADVSEGRRRQQGFEFDPELRSVLELATDSELSEIQTILFGPSYLSPLLKSITSGSSNMDPSMIEHDIQLRQHFIETLESRFFFLAADARSTLRGWRPSYRNVLLHLTSKLNIPCSTQLHTHHLELEIFLHLFHFNSHLSASSHSQWKHFQSLLFKGGGIFTLAKIYQLLASKLSGKMLIEAANYQVKKELLKKGGQVALINLESRAALLAAKQGFLGAASRYLGFRSMLTLLGPVNGQLLKVGNWNNFSGLWGTLLADLVIQMLGTDYARILRTIYALAQIRVIRTYKLLSDIAEE